MAGDALRFACYVCETVRQCDQHLINERAGCGSNTNLSLCFSPYVASKCAITGLSRLAATESAEYQVRVNSIHPSPANTQMMCELEANANPDDPDGMLS